MMNQDDLETPKKEEEELVEKLPYEAPSVDSIALSDDAADSLT